MARSRVLGALGNLSRFDQVLNSLGLTTILKFKNHYKTKRNLAFNRNKSSRQLEIGPGEHRIKGFETLNIVDSPHTDYICNLSNPLPFENNSFSLIYSSHTIEHIAWYELQNVFDELYRILESKGVLEIWVPDGLKICQNLINVESGLADQSSLDGWYRFNPTKNPYLWVSGRIFSYGDGTATYAHPNWHRSLLTPSFLRELFENSGFQNITILDHSRVRGYDHGWINLGIAGIKP